MQYSAGFSCLVFELIYSLTDSGVIRRFPGQSDPSLQAQVFDAYYREALRHRACEFVQKVVPQIRGSFMGSRNLQLPFLSIVRSLLLPSESALKPLQFALSLPVMSLGFALLAIAESRKSR